MQEVKIFYLLNLTSTQNILRLIYMTMVRGRL
uniref:Uncharacterized protein n=1 Tax=Siphoviridae sp. ctXZx16 TaxID=2826371 RepID=A0A8S5MKQ8_9CAUD|nr:MAG TPA: hypothetical protein [Siphoviridae sp. ctXZx16]DAO32127.1 MAG TPA: hypothetical protein [Caudoviricetes sp.]